MNLKTKLFGGILLVFLSITNINAQQEGFLGEIKMFGGNFAPRGWAFCEGQLLAISQNTALFSILGTTYGGDGRTTFGLPDLRGRVAISAGRGPGLQDYRQGAKGGSELRTLNITQIPSHNHMMSLANVTGSALIPVNTEAGNEDESNPGAGVLANTGADRFSSEATPNAIYGGRNVPIVLTGNGLIGNTGGNQSFDNRQPFTTVRYIICLQGVFPSRN
ncbi:Microcystin-dependent protein [Tenacibaculum sp. 190130A14a]|uniref:Microcystin-dependent protein n=1 Tax=Tenacibaculum polynesiense TaxID=3137857 RepID=A0ABP1F0V6_9FLAO